MWRARRPALHGKEDPVLIEERLTKADRARQGDASSPRREGEGVRMHVEPEQRRRAPRIRRRATGAFVRRSEARARHGSAILDPVLLRAAFASAREASSTPAQIPVP